MFHAIWPAPVDGDHCFKEAGFEEFYGVEAEVTWDTEYLEIIRLMFANLRRFGDPRPRWDIMAIDPVESQDWRPTFPRSRWPIVSDPIEQIVVTSNWVADDLGDAVIDWGQPSIVTVRTSWGRPILWLASSKSSDLSVEELAEQMAGGRTVRKVELRWEHLVPGKPPRSRSDAV